VGTLKPLSDASPGELAVCIAADAVRRDVLRVLKTPANRGVVVTTAELAIRLSHGTRGMAVVDDPVLDLLLVDPKLSVARAPWTASLLLIVPGDSIHQLRRALRAGVGAVLVDDRIETLPAVVGVARTGHLCVPASMRQPLSRPVLSQRERQTLALAIGGLTNAEVASRLFVAPSTVKTHLSAAFQKLGLRSRAEAAALVQDPEEGLSELILGSALTPTKSIHAERGQPGRYPAAGVWAADPRPSRQLNR
jgi:DNA-binding NarL/FixJ family response regulator